MREVITTRNDSRTYSQRTVLYGNLMMQIEYRLVHFKRIMKNTVNDIMFCPLTYNNILNNMLSNDASKNTLIFKINIHLGNDSMYLLPN